MINARLLNADSTINNYRIVGGIEFVAGTTVRIPIQLYNTELAIRHIPSLDPTVTLTVNCSDGTSETITMLNTGFELDQSIWFVDIVTDDVNSAGKTLVGGNITLDISNDTNILAGNTAKGIIFNALQRLIVT